jgi:hypothetical protein
MDKLPDYRVLKKFCLVHYRPSLQKQVLEQCTFLLDFFDQIHMTQDIVPKDPTETILHQQGMVYLIHISECHSQTLDMKVSHSEVEDQNNFWFDSERIYHM